MEKKEDLQIRGHNSIHFDKALLPGNSESSNVKSRNKISKTLSTMGQTVNSGTMSTNQLGLNKKGLFSTMSNLAIRRSLAEKIDGKDDDFGTEQLRNKSIH